MLAMLATNGLYIGDLSPAGRLERVGTHVLGGQRLAVCQVCPGRSTASTVDGSMYLTLSATTLGEPIAPTRNQAIPDEIGHPAVDRAEM